MTTIALVVGSVTGTALDVAEQLQAALEAQKYTVTLYNDVHTLPLAERLLFCTSTTGRGELPGRLRFLIEAIATDRIEVKDQRYGVIALGDQRYPTFCGAGRHLDRVMAAKGGLRVGERLELDAQASDYPDEAALAWLPGWLESEIDK